MWFLIFKPSFKSSKTMKFLSNWTNKPESEVLCNNICFFSTANARCRQPSFLLLGHKLTRLGANLSGREIGWIGKADAEGWWQPLNILHHQLALVVGPGGPDVPAHFSPPGLQKGGFGRMAALQFSEWAIGPFSRHCHAPSTKPSYLYFCRTQWFTAERGTRNKELCGGAVVHKEGGFSFLAQHHLNGDQNLQPRWKPSSSILASEARFSRCCLVFLRCREIFQWKPSSQTMQNPNSDPICSLSCFLLRRHLTLWQSQT